MRMLVSSFIATSLLMSVAAATAASAGSFKPSGGIIKTGPIKPICSSNPKACGAGYDPLGRPHVPTPPPPRPQ